MTHDMHELARVFPKVAPNKPVHCSGHNDARQTLIIEPLNSNELDDVGMLQWMMKECLLGYGLA